MNRMASTLFLFIILFAAVHDCPAQTGGAIAVRNVSTDTAPAVLLSWNNEVLQPWKELRIERSMADSVWKAVRTVRFPAESMPDYSVLPQHSYHYRARRIMVDETERLEWGDTITVLPDVAIDLLDYLVPQPRTERTYRYRYYSHIEHLARETSVRYSPLDTEFPSDHVQVFPFRKIVDSVSGTPDTVITAFLCKFDSIPRVLVDDTMQDGWNSLELLNLVDGSESRQSVAVHIGESYSRPWKGERFVANDSIWGSGDRANLHVIIHHDNSVLRASVACHLKRDVGVQWIGRQTDGVSTPVHERDTLALISTTAAQREVSSSIYGITSVWPHPVGAAASVSVDLAAPSSLYISVCDALGREVSVLADGFRGIGRHVLTFDASRLPRGLYFIRAIAGREMRTQRLLLR